MLNAEIETPQPRKEGAHSVTDLTVTPNISKSLYSYSIMSSLVTSARYAVEYVRFYFACLSLKNILWKANITIRNRFGINPLDGGMENENSCSSGICGKASTSNQDDEGKLIKFVLLNNQIKYIRRIWKSLILRVISLKVLVITII